MRADQADVLMRAADLRSDACLTEVWPHTVGRLDGPTLVRTVETLTVRPVCAESEPEGVVACSVMNIRVDLGTTHLAISPSPVEAVRQPIAAFAAEDDDGRELRTRG